MDATRIFQLHRYIYHVSHGTTSIIAYFGKFKIWWDELATIDYLILDYVAYNVLLTNNKEKEKLIQILSGLNETLVGVRTNLLIMHILFCRKRINNDPFSWNELFIYSSAKWLCRKTSPFSTEYWLSCSFSDLHSNQVLRILHFDRF